MISKIEERKSITFGQTYDFIELDKYTNKANSIKIRLENTDIKIQNWKLNDMGQLVINTKNIDFIRFTNPYTTKFTIEYEPSGMPIELEEINTVKGLMKNINELKSFDYIKSMRWVAANKFKIKLNEFVIHNAILFDSYGQTMKLNYKEKDRKIFAEIISLKIFELRIKNYSIQPATIPNHDTICPHCGQKWTIENIDDHIRQEDASYHIECNKFRLYEKSKKEFDYIASTVFEKYEIHAVKNEYGSESYNGYWFIISSPEGDIKIGWRKRVIQIEWLKNYKDFKFTAETIVSTKEFSENIRFIHAWTIEKAIKYLRKARESII